MESVLCDSAVIIIIDEKIVRGFQYKYLFGVLSSKHAVQSKPR